MIVVAIRIKANEINNPPLTTSKELPSIYLYSYIIIASD
jgi:hypothetical protein